MSANVHRLHHAKDEGRTADSLARYLNEIAAYPLLTREQEADLGRRIREGDDAAVQELVCANLRFVVAVAKKYQNRGVALLDLINEGNLGLIRAAERFDEAKGVKFISYAVWWIRQSVVQALAEHSQPVRLPVGRAATLHRIGRRASVLRQELGREPTPQEVAQGLEGSERELALSISVARPHLSLDATLGSDSDATLLDILPLEESAAADDELLDSNRSESIERALERLRPRDAEIIRLYFGFDGNDPMSLEAIGERLGVTRERIRQVRDRALGRMRRFDHGLLASFTR